MEQIVPFWHKILFQHEKLRAKFGLTSDFEPSKIVIYGFFPNVSLLSPKPYYSVFIVFFPVFRKTRELISRLFPCFGTSFADVLLSRERISRIQTGVKNEKV